MKLILMKIKIIDIVNYKNIYTFKIHFDIIQDKHHQMEI